MDANHWDLIIIDEAHKMSASYFAGEVQYTSRFRLGQRLAERCRHFLLMTATPHNGKDEDFHLFLSLLDPDRFEGRPRGNSTPGGHQSVDARDLMRRMVKEQLRRFDGTPLFPPRRAQTLTFELSPAERSLYDGVTTYVRDEFNRAESAEDGRRRTVGFALTVLQRRLASSPEAIYQSLRRRRERLERRVREIDEARRSGISVSIPLPRGEMLSAEDLDMLADDTDLSADELERIEDSIADEASAATTVEDLRIEIEMLGELERQADGVRRRGGDCKWDRLSGLLQDSEEMVDAAGRRRKLIIFTEHRDTLEYLRSKIGTLLGRPESIVVIHGGVNRDARRGIEERFRYDADVEILLATDAASEGLNLQRAHLMVNYDLPWNPNRLEQRFGRIHRIGQTEVCHLWNLVANDTREGEVYGRLLDKIEDQRRALGGRDAVFDVLGELVSGRQLRDLMTEAVRYGQRPWVKAALLEKIDMATETRHVRELIERDALARDSMDARRVQQVREDMERAEAKRLQPFYVQAWFVEAFKQVGGRMVRRETGRFEITRVPAVLRHRDQEIGRGTPVLDRYERVTFEKDRIRQGDVPAAFLCPGHPLLTSLISLTLQRHRGLLRRGTVLLNPHDASDRLRVMFILDHSIRDGTTRPDGQPRVISRRLQFVLLDETGDAEDAGSAPYVDWLPMSADQIADLGDRLRPQWMDRDLEHEAVSLAVTSMVPEHLSEVRAERDPMLDKTADAVRQRLTAEIQYWDHRANELAEAERRGKPTRLASTVATNRADELTTRRDRRLALIGRQRHLAPAPPVVVGGALVVPAGMLAACRNCDATDDAATPADEDRDLSADRRAEIDRLAVAAVMDAERRLGRNPREMPHHNVGYDVETLDADGRLRFIEVKGKAVGRETVTVSSSQIRTCFNKPGQWALAIVMIDGDSAAEPAYLYDLFDAPPTFAEAGRNLRLADLLPIATGPR